MNKITRTEFKPAFALAAIVLVLAVMNHTWLIQQACWNDLIDDSTAEYIGAALDGRL